MRIPEVAFLFAVTLVPAALARAAVSDYIITSQADVDALGLTGGQKYFNRRMIIARPGVYDFKNTLFYWNGKGKCGAPENQPYIMRISAGNVTVRNFGYKNAPDGIHIGTADDGQGYNYGNVIRNIRLENVTGWACEAAMHTQYGAKDVTIVNSRFYGNPNYAEADKILQLNFSDVTIINSEFHDSRVCVMFKGDQKITVSNSYFKGCERGIVGETLFGILGKIGKGPSVLNSDHNRADVPGDYFNFRYYAIANDDKITVNSSGDVANNGGVCKANNGGHCNVKP